MPATTTHELYDIDDLILSASSAAVRSLGIGSVYQEKDTEKAVTPFVAFTIQSGNPIHQWYLESTGSVYDAWNYSMNAVICTNRYNNNVSHSIYRNKVIDKIADYRTYDNLPYHIVDNMRVTNVGKGMDESNDLDMSTINIDFNVWIKPSAWPA